MKPAHTPATTDAQETHGFSESSSFASAYLYAHRRGWWSDRTREAKVLEMPSWLVSGAVTTTFACLAVLALALMLIARLFPTGARTLGGTMNHKNHLKYMLLAGAGIAAVLLATGVRPGQALLTAAVLACPLMMVGMMFFMSRGTGGSAHSHSGGEHSGGEHSGGHNSYPAETPASVPPTRNNHEEIS